MWFIFILPVALLGAAASVLGLTSAGSFVVVTVAADQWQRRRGHKPGEGVFTDREGGDLFGLSVVDGSGDLGQFLSVMADVFPDMFGEFDGVSFDLTVSEGEFLRCMVQVAQVQLERCHLTPRGPEKDRELEVLRAALEPVAMYLRAVPATRVRKGEGR